MNSLAIERPVADSVPITRRLRLIWKHPTTRRYHQIGWFEELDDGHFGFRYEPGVNAIAGFAPLLQFPDISRSYVSPVFPAFFANRVMSSKRSSYGQYLGWLGLAEDAAPIEVLARTGGARATDTFHVVDAFDPIAGKREGRFFASGIRHCGEWVANLTALEVGQPLALVDEPDNPIDQRAILLCDNRNPVGWVPAWLVDEVHRFRGQAPVHGFVEQINLDAPPHLALLCRLEQYL